jgi:hypothetical protein
MARTIPNKGYGGIYGEEAAGKSPDDVRGQRANEAANDFANAEKSASESAPKVKDNSTSGSTDIAENGGAMHTPKYSGGPALAGAAAGGGAMAMAAKATPMGRIANMFKGNGDGGNKKPLIAMGSLTGIIGIFMLLVSGSLPIHLINNFSDMRNTMNTQNNLRGTKLIKHLFNPKNEAESLFNKRNRMSDRRVSQLNHDLEVQGMRFMADGDQMVLKVAAPNDLDADGRINWDGVTDVVRTEADFTTRFNDDATFRNTFNKGARVMTGKNAGWFNTALAGLLGKNKLTRNLFAKFIAENGNSPVAEARAKLEVQADAVTKADVQATSIGERTNTDGDTEISGLGTVSARNADFNARKIQIANDIKAKASRFAVGGIIGAVAGGTCAVMMAVSAVSAVYAYQQAMEGLAVVAGWFEAGQKPLAGDGDESYHAFGSMLTESTVTTVTDEDGNEQPINNGAKISPTESAGLAQVLVGGAISGGDQSALKYNMDKAFGAANMAVAQLNTCAAVIAGAAIFGAVMFAVEVVVAALTFGVGAAIWEVVEEGLSTIASSTILGWAVGAVAPMIAAMFVRKLATEVGGEDFGNMVASFGTRYFFGGHQANGGVGMTFDQAFAYYQETQTVLAMQAETDRAARSPFDITSNNTFLGSIASQLAAHSSTNSSSLLGMMSGLGGLASSAKGFNMFVPASAIDQVEFRQQVGVDANGNNLCPALSSINAIGDQFCNPIRGSDLSTVQDNPEDIFWHVAYTCTTSGSGQNIDHCSFQGDRKDVSSAEFQTASGHGDPWARCSVNDPYALSGWSWGSSGCNGDKYQAYVFNLNSNGLEQVNSDSDLGRMITYGVDRNSDIGVLDANIVSMESSTGPQWLGYIPLIGDILDVVTAVKSANPKTVAWANGSNICAGCNPEWSTTYKYLSQYISDTNIYEGMGGLDKSPVTAFLETEIYPYMDRTFEGRLAAMMGMPKDWVVSTLAFAEDMNNVPRDVNALVASSPSIYTAYYGGLDLNELKVPVDDDPCKVLDSARECTQIAGTELRRRFNAEAVA